MNKLTVVDRPDASPASTRTDTVEFRLDEILRILWRRKWILIWTVALIMAAAVVYIRGLEPLYTATATVMVDPRDTQIAGLPSLITGLSGAGDTIESEIEVIRSRNLARKVIEELALDELAEFNPSIEEEEEPSWTDSLPAWRDLVPDSWLIALEDAGIIDPEEEDEDWPADILDAVMVDNYLSRLDVEQINRSRAIALSFTAEYPDLAMEIINAHAEFYVVQHLNAKLDTAERATSWLTERLAELKTQTETSEAAVEEFRSGSAVLEGQDTALIAQQLTELNTQLVAAKTDYDANRARLDSVQGLQSSGQLRAVFDLLDSPLISELRAQQAALLQQRAQLSSQFASGHPTMLNLNAQIGALSAQMDAEARNVIGGLSNEVIVAQSRVTSLTAAIQDMSERAAQLGDVEVQLRALQREADANRTLYEALLARSKEADQDVTLEQPDIWILSAAPFPLFSSYPPTRLLYVAFLVVAAGIGLVLMFAMELLDNGYRSSEQIERDFDLSGFGLIPQVRTGRLKRSPPQDVVVDKPASAYSEAIRTLYTSLLIAQQKARAGNAFVFTSASLGEGKTAVVASLGRVAAKSGQRAIVIDCDLRRPQIHAALNLPNDTGLVTYLKDGAPLEEVVRVDERSGAHVITAGPAVDDPQVLFRLPAMERLLSYLRSQYDVVLIDAPPVLPVSDPRVLATLTDLCVFIIQWKRTPRSLVRNAIHKLQQAGATIAGAVLTQVEIKAHAMYGYGDSGHYHGRMKEYYKKRA